MQPKSIDQIFWDAAQIASAGERDAYLDDACAGDGELRRRVEHLLRARSGAEHFLEAPSPHLVATADVSVSERPGAVIGAYKLLQQIGEGGMGVVYMAEQQKPVRRKVALKIIKPGMDNRQVIARFEAERQALALMDHINIARVLDAGTTESGRPYFVMELVHGVPITRYCDDNKLTLRERLGLFVPVCQAIQHAHQKGIIHRDVKPSNVLVTMYDDKPVPKVIDFGVAKAVEQRLTEKTLFTQFGAMVGTVEYMSPEQAEPNAFGVDTRSDVYSLGVLLYELLTGTTPLERQRLREAAYGEIVRLIKEEEPPRPSRRLSSSGAALASISQRRGTPPAKLTSLVRGELDWIVMRCLEKDRTRRYETANGLARDVERYLKDEPVEACPPSAGYRLRKLARKYRRPLAAAAGFVLLLLAGAAISLWQAVRATDAERDATAQRNAALASEEKARQNEGSARESAQVAQENAVKAKAAQADLRRSLYLSNLGLIQTAWDANNAGRVLELLEATRPKPDEEDLRGFEWYYWRRLCHSDLGTVRLFYPHGEITPHNLVLSPNGQFVAGRVFGSGLKAWEAATGKPVAAFPGTSYNALPAFSPDGKRLASWVVVPPEPGETRTWLRLAIKVFEVGTGKELFALQNSPTDAGNSPRTEASRYPSRQFGLTFSADGKRIGVLTPGRMRVKVWDANDGKELLSVEPFPRATEPGPPAWIASAPALRPDGQEVAVPVFHFAREGDPPVRAESHLRLLDASGGTERLRIPTPTPESGLAYHPDGKRLAANMGVERAAEGEEEFRPPSVCVWDTATGKQLLRIATSSRLTMRGLAFSPDGKALAGWNHIEPVVYLWDADTGKARLTLKGPTSLIVDVVFSADSRRLHVAQQDGAVKVWDVAPLAPLVERRTARSGLPTVLATTHAGDGLRLAVEDRPATARVGTAKPSVVQVLGPDGRELRRLALAGWLSAGVGDVAFSPDGTALATLSLAPVEPAPQDKPASPPALVYPHPGTVQVWDLATGREVWSAATLQGPNPRVVWQGRRIAVTAPIDKGERKVRGLLLLDALTGKEVWRTACPGARALTFSPDGARLAAQLDLGFSSRVMVWDVPTGELLRTFADIPVTPLQGILAFSRDGKRLALASNPQRTLDAQPPPVTVWDLDTGDKLLTVQGQAESVNSIDFSPDGKRLVSAGERQQGGGEVKLWDLTAGRELLTLSPERGLGHVHFSLDGQRLLGIRNDRAGLWLQAWDATPLTPEVEGRALLFALAAELPARSEVIERLRGDPLIGDAVRRAALAQANTFLHDDPERLNHACWLAVIGPGRRPEEYRRGLRWAERAVALAPQDGMILNTLGAAQYRNELYKEALETLTRSDEMRKGQAPDDAAFLALTHHRLGNAEKAREYLERLRKQVRRTEQDLLAEVEALMKSTGP